MKSSPAAQPEFLSAWVSATLMFAVPSKKPIRFLGIGWLRLFPVRPNPASSQRGLATGRASLISSCTAWNATCGSLAQTCTPRSPPLIDGCRASCRNTGKSTRGEALRRQAEPVAVAEQRRAEAERHREARRAHAESRARVAGQTAPRLDRADEIAGCPQGRRP